MLSVVCLTRKVQVFATTSTTARTYHVGRATSVHTAIARGIRKSNGLGFRGKRKPSLDDPREKYKERNGLPEYTPKPRFHRPVPQEASKSPWLVRGRVNKPDVTEDGKTQKDKRFNSVIERNNSAKTTGRSSNYSSLIGRGRGQGQSSSSWQRRKDLTQTLASLGPSSATQDASWTDKRYMTPRIADQNELPPYQRRPRFLSDHQINEPRIDNRRDSSYDKWLIKGSGFQGQERPHERSTFEHTSNGSSKAMQEKEGSVSFFDRRLPLSIPYTTPASEFLYGTSPILSALQSTRHPRRKMYKLYIHSTPQREAPSQDQNVVRLAKRAGVAIENVTGDGIRLLDKMSGGRPHNGYILEASPLPKLPVLALGQVNSRGFDIVLGHQSREDAMVNGTETFIPIPQQNQQKHQRQPLVLYLDSITDPGNLGGIIRTASFLGVSAVAISTRNSAPFSPVVLKASAGAAENITIFSVDKPAGFIVDSKASGWKVYAAVAPEKGVDRPSVSVEKLDDPLSDSPIILMLGSEGEGLRWNLRSKADLDLYIRGANGRGSVDSLNVSVAAGVLCNALLRAPKRSKSRAAAPQRNTTTDTAEQIIKGGEDTASQTAESEDGQSQTEPQNHDGEPYPSKKGNNALF